LTGITIRNLTSSGLTSRRRAESVDDEALPQSLQSPAKLLAQKELRALEHSRSSTDLVLLPIRENAGKENDASPRKTPTRPSSKRLRRRSTLDWANASPYVRQTRLEEDARARMMDVFFSLHVAGIEDPIYVSETINQTMNPTFATFSLENQAAQITRQDTVTLKVWTRGEGKTDFSLHMEIELSLKYLDNIGRSLDAVRNPLPRNCVLFGLTDGIYALPTSSESMDRIAIVDSRASISTRILSTSSYDALMRLSTLDACVQDALATRSRVEAEINAILEEHKSDTDILHNVAPSNIQLSAVKTAVEAERRRLEVTRRRRDLLRTNISARESFMTSDLSLQSQQRELMAEEQSTIEANKEAHQRNIDATHGQRRRICEDMQRIFPIEPIPDKALTFTIRGLFLPNSSNLDDADDTTVSAALGYVAQVVYMLSAYLSKPLPYPLSLRGSTSTVSDMVSASTSTTVYPLFTKGVARFRFEYAVFLLNKDIEILSNHVGLRVMDVRHTLPNLKYLLYITTAGTGELPARKAGGMRAFLRAATGETSLGSSRRGSDASSAAGVVGRFLKKAQDGETKNEEGSGSTNGAALLPAPKLGKYKASNLREGG
jgi:UV radiation resistance-associated gene protein